MKEIGKQIIIVVKYQNGYKHIQICSSLNTLYIIEEHKKIFQGFIHHLFFFSFPGVFCVPLIQKRKDEKHENKKYNKRQ